MLNKECEFIILCPIVYIQDLALITIYLHPLGRTAIFPCGGLTKTKEMIEMCPSISPLSLSLLVSYLPYCILAVGNGICMHIHINAACKDCSSFKSM